MDNGRRGHGAGGDGLPAADTELGAGAPPLVELRGISRRHARALILDRVDLELAPGELHVLVGSRGAGKSTLLRLLAGLERPDSGQILVRGDPQRIDSPRAALRLGIGALLERPAVAETLTVAESVVLGAEPGRLLLGRRRAAQRVEALGGELGLSLDPQARVGALTPAERRQVELLALAHRRASVLLLDDWSGGLTDDRAEELLTALAKLRATGSAVLAATRPGGPSPAWRTGSQGWRTAALPTTRPRPGLAGRCRAHRAASRSSRSRDSGRPARTGSGSPAPTWTFAAARSTDWPARPARGRPR